MTMASSYIPFVPHFCDSFHWLIVVPVICTTILYCKFAYFKDSSNKQDRGWHDKMCFFQFWDHKGWFFWIFRVKLPSLSLLVAELEATGLVIFVQKLRYWRKKLLSTELLIFFIWNISRVQPQQVSCGLPRNVRKKVFLYKKEISAENIPSQKGNKNKFENFWFGWYRRKIA